MNDHIKNYNRIKDLPQPEYFLSFIFLVKQPSQHTVIRVFYREQIIEEVICESAIETVHVPLKYQQDIQFEMLSNKNNWCKCFFVSLGSLSRTSWNTVPNKYAMKFLFTKTSWHKDTPWEFIPYTGSLFGVDKHDKVLKPNKIKLKHESNLAHESNRFWIDTHSKNRYVEINASWVSKFRSGYACFYIKNKNLTHNIRPNVNIFKHVEFDLENNFVTLTKSTNTKITIPIDQLMRVKKITNAEQYLNFVFDALIFYPAVILNWNDFKL